jgi:hypothetical protein
MPEYSNAATLNTAANWVSTHSSSRKCTQKMHVGQRNAPAHGSQPIAELVCQQITEAHAQLHKQPH